MAAALRVYRGRTDSVHGGPVDRPAGTFARVPDESLGDERLSDGARVVLAGLMSGVWSRATVVFRTQEELAQATGRSLSAVKRALRLLEATGYIERDRDYSKTYAPHCYRLLFRLRGPTEALADRVLTAGAVPGGVSASECMQPASCDRCAVRVWPEPGSGLDGSPLKEERRGEKPDERPSSPPTIPLAGSSSTPAREYGSEPCLASDGVDAVVKRCREGDRGARSLLRAMVASGLDVGGLDADPRELGEWLVGRLVGGGNGAGQGGG